MDVKRERERVIGLENRDKTQTGAMRAFLQRGRDFQTPSKDIIEIIAERGS